MMNRCHSLRAILRNVPESLEELQGLAELSLFPMVDQKLPRMALID